VLTARELVTVSGRSIDLLLPRVHALEIAAAGERERERQRQREREIRGGVNAPRST
jgi:hypothetical protein